MIVPHGDEGPTRARVLQVGVGKIPFVDRAVALDRQGVMKFAVGAAVGDARDGRAHGFGAVDGARPLRPLDRDRACARRQCGVAELLFRAGLMPPRRRRFGPVEAKVREDVENLVSAHPMGEALAEMAFALAKVLDEGAGLATAAVNRELRANLVELARMGVPDDDDLGDRLSSPVRDAEES